MGGLKMEASKKQLIKELREYLDKAEKDETTYCELLMEIPELLKGFNCGLEVAEFDPKDVLLWNWQK